MTTTELLYVLQSRANAGESLSVAELRDATWQTVRFLVFAVTSGEADQLDPLSGGITQVTEAYFDRIDRGEDGPREWARSLAIVGQIAVALYESLGPTAEAQKILGRSQHARNVAKILLSKGTVQAKELRELAAIQHQPTLARIIHALASARIVAVESGPGNTAWYRLTPEGSRLLRSAVLSPTDVSIPATAEVEVSQRMSPPTEELVSEIVLEISDLIKRSDLIKGLEELRSKAQKKAPESQKPQVSDEVPLAR